MAVRTFSQRLSRQRLETVAVVSGRLGRRSGQCHADQLPAARELLCTMAVAEEAVIANTVKPVRQHMDQEAADELPGLEGHGLLTVVIPVILPAEADLAVVHGDQAVVGDGNTVGIAADVIENLSRPGKW